MEDTMALIKAISYIVWPICLVLIVFIFRKEIRTVLLSLVQKKVNENIPVVDILSDTPKPVTDSEEPDEPRGQQPSVALPPEDQLSVKVCKNSSGHYFVVLDDEENDEKIYCITPQGIPKWIEKRILQTIEFVNVDMLGEEQLNRFYKFIENAEPDAAEVGIIRKPLIAYYLPSYIRMVNNPNTEPSRMLAYIKNKGQGTWYEIKQYLHDTYGYELISGAMGASLKALETLGLVKINGQGDGKKITYIGQAVISDQLQDLLKYVREENRICPQPSKWHELWEMLPDKHRVGSGWNPPLPLILAAWDHTTGLEKMLRLKQHIEYAAEKGVLDLVEQFLKNLPRGEWYTAGK